MKMFYGLLLFMDFCCGSANNEKCFMDICFDLVGNEKSPGRPRKKNWLNVDLK